MSLAEIFLLMLFCLFLAANVDNKGRGQSGDLASLSRGALIERILAEQEHVKVLDDQVSWLRARLQEMRDIIDYLKDWTGAGNPTVSDIQRGVERRVKEGARGAPMCDDPNTLVEALVVDGKTQLQVLSLDPALQEALKREGIVLSVGTRLTDAVGIDAFLNAVWDFEHGRNCRYDYRLIYLSSGDYQMGRERFEKYFYPAELRRL